MVVSDVSPIINLAAIGELGLLRERYGRICIPEAVHQEITRFEEQPGAQETRARHWIEQRSCERHDLVRACGFCGGCFFAAGLMLAVLGRG